MANVFRGPLNPAAHPGERWRLGECGCEGVIGESITRVADGDDDGAFVYHLTADVQCTPAASHWGVNVTATGAHRLTTSTPAP